MKAKAVLMRIALCLLPSCLVVNPASAEIDFQRDIRPILSDKCIGCHGPDAENRAADLRLDLEEPAKEDLGGYHVIDVASPGDSELLLRILSDDEYEVMPPADSHKTLSAKEKQLFQQWIEEGAKWADPWAYVKPARSAPPEVKNKAWIANSIDPFVLAKLETAGYAPAPEADPVTLIRRLAFDLTGLPPQQAIVDRYRQSPTEETYAQIVDQLLASPRFGERMAIYWLDLVRYADTVGYHGDQNINVWPYRDYVIHAFNTNKPFDQFTREQLAGDLLPNADQDTLIASAYNRLLQTSHEGGVQLKEYRSIYMADRVRNVSQVWMAATMGCSQCHDHKFDPLSMHEFYALGAFFADLDDEDHLRNQYDVRNNRNPTHRAYQAEVTSVYQRRRQQRLQAAMTQLHQQEDLQAIQQLSDLQAEAAKPTLMPVSHAIEPHEVRVQDRGDWQDESGEVVLPQAPAVLGGQPAQQRATRLDLANWLTDAQQGSGLLTARVMANRFWYLMFGEGLSRSLGDFGGQGMPPTHPQLLDKLAIDFVESGWDVKHMLKQIAMSRTYRQSSVADEALLTADPENLLLARQGRYRLTAEMIRDAALSTSGLLVERLGGPSVKPYQPADYYKHLNFPSRSYQADQNANQWRRGVYVHWQRQYLHPTLKALDAPTREECTAQRSRSNTPLASLALLNDPTFVEAARAFAAELLSGSADTPEKLVDQLFVRALSRQPAPQERQAVLQLVQQQRTYYSEHQQAAQQLLQVGLHEQQTASDDLADLAAWTFACRTVFNLGEAVTRN